MFADPFFSDLYAPMWNARDPMENCTGVAKPHFKNNKPRGNLLNEPWYIQMNAGKCGNTMLIRNVGKVYVKLAQNSLR